MSPDHLEPVLALKDPQLVWSAAALIFALMGVFGLWVWHLIEEERKHPRRRPPNDHDQYPPVGWP